MACQFDSTFGLGGNVTIGDFPKDPEDFGICEATYTRPDPGGAMIPWLYALFILFFHLPACIIRASRWESAQYLALGLAAFGIALTIQAYVSTGLAPAKVLVWMPLTLILDVGAMLQLFVLIIEKHGKRNLVQALQRSKLGRLLTSKPTPANQDNEALRHACVAITALILLIMLLVLQLIGLAYAIHGKPQVGAITVAWCSPAFQDSTLAVRTGNCDLYKVISSASQGIGCIGLPATEQKGWLIGTIVLLAAALIMELLDGILLRCAKGKRFRKVRMQRPWLTMFSGIIILIVIVFYGVMAASHLPNGVTSTVWAYKMENSPSAVPRVCRGTLFPSGLRGQIIGYTDGLFGSWDSVYRGID